ncbi:hypothetical protein PHSC3_001210 [Chlamydiales bacterium STE3]|nr:hypothetical protein PHSC3_001210 [Chlamydiales bacterium STE3]
MKNWIQRHSSKFIALMLICTAVYGIGRLYFELTGGFAVRHISSNLTFDPQREIHFSTQQKEAVSQILHQHFHYLGKGCQSYVFLSEDGKYVIKFLKYQRFRPQKFLDVFSFLPFVEKIRQQKLIKKNERLNNLFSSWKIAAENLNDETGIVFLHLNKTSDLNPSLVIYDKLGLKHTLNPNQLEFMIQKRAEMLCPTIDEYMVKGEKDKAKKLLTNLLEMILSEYQRGLADNDHALMQNTGVIEGKPVHIDVGQFESNKRFLDKKEYGIELFSKMYKFRIWLSKRHPELESFLTAHLLKVLGPEMWSMTPRLKTLDEAA